MKIKRINRLLCSVLAVLMLFTSVAFASDVKPTEPNRASEYISSYYASCTAEGNGVIGVYFSVNGKSMMSSIGAYIIRVQSNASGSWATVGAIPGSVSNGLLTNNAIMYSYTYNYINATPGVSYRAIVDCYAANSNGSDTKPYTTASVKAT